MADIENTELEKFFLPEELIGKKVILRPRSHQYDKGLFQLIDSSRIFLREFLFWVDGTDSVDKVKQITDLFQENWKKGEAFEYVFLDKQTEKLVGAGGIHTISRLHRYAEYGYYLDKNATGQEYVSEAVELLGAELFKKGIHRLQIVCDVQNHASAAVAKRCGFALKGIMKESRFAYGEYRDMLMFAKLYRGEKK